MSDVIDIDSFKKSLAEEGLTDVTVQINKDPYGMSIKIMVKKTVNGERIGIENSISEDMLMKADNQKKHMATVASNIARQFQDFITEQFEWGDHRVLLDIKDELTATCHYCRTEVSMDDLNGRNVLMAETAEPRPPSPSFKNLPPVKIRLTLLALLRDECDPMCPNSPGDRNF